jgi:hypothetical protein
MANGSCTNSEKLGVPVNVLIKRLMVTRYLNGEMVISGGDYLTLLLEILSVH